MYLAAIFLLKNILNGVELFTMAYLPQTLVIIAVTWFPPFAYDLIRSWLNPTDEQKLMRNSQL